MIDVDNQEYSHEDCREPDLQDIVDHDQGYDEYKEKRAGIFDEIDKREYDAYMANTENFSEEEEDPNEPTPSQMNEELRRGGW
jgi:hypothetical protein